jgi:hypothetical protein
MNTRSDREYLEIGEKYELITSRLFRCTYAAASALNACNTSVYVVEHRQYSHSKLTSSSIDLYLSNSRLLDRSSIKLGQTGRYLSGFVDRKRSKY